MDFETRVARGGRDVVSASRPLTPPIYQTNVYVFEDMTSLQTPEQLLKDIHKKDAPYSLALIPAKASFSGLWVYKEDHTEARVLGALSKLKPGFLSLDAVCEAIKEAEWGSDLKAASAGKAHDRLTTRPVNMPKGPIEVWLGY